MTDDLFSVRMRATDGDAHISGAETIVPADRVAATASQLLSRALDHPRGDADDVVVTADRLDETPQRTSALPVVTVETTGVGASRRTARRLLTDAGLTADVVDRGATLLKRGTAERGAALLDPRGERRDPDPERGVRVSRVGASATGAAELDTALDAADLASTRIRDALLLATKVVNTPGVVAELCWSDNPDYTAGYVATDDGYFRFPALKPRGDPRGGRVFFLESGAAAATIDFLETRPVLVDGVDSFRRVPPGDLPLDA